MRGKITKKQLSLVIGVLAVMCLIVLLGIFHRNTKDKKEIAYRQVSEENIKEALILSAEDWSCDDVAKNLSEISLAGYHAVKLNTGDVEGLKSLHRTAEKYGIKIILDGVPEEKDRNGEEQKDDTATVEARAKVYAEAGVDGFDFTKGLQLEDGIAESYDKNTIQRIKKELNDAGMHDIYYYLPEEVEEKDEYSFTLYNVKDVVEGLAAEDSEKIVQALEHINGEHYILQSGKNTIRLEDNQTIDFSKLSETTRNKLWALMTSKKNMGAMYDAGYEKDTKIKPNTFWKDITVVSANKFHNKSAKREESISKMNQIIVNERYMTDDITNSGAVIINVTGKATDIENLEVTNLPDGNYIDDITGSVFVVSNHRMSGQIGDTGLAIINGTVSEESTTKNEMETTTNTAETTVISDENSTTIYFDASNCQWFANDNASPALKADEGEFQKMKSFETEETKKTLYYSKISKDTKKVTIARMLPNGKTTNPYTVKYQEGYNLYTSKSDWSAGGVWASYEGKEPDTVTDGTDSRQEHTKDTTETESHQGSIVTETTQSEDNPQEETKEVFGPDTQVESEKKDTTTQSVQQPPVQRETTKPSEVKTVEKQMIKIYFSNNTAVKNRKWDEVYCYYWGGNNAKEEWPGRKMSFVEYNGYNEPVYSIEIPSDVSGIVFSNGKTNSALIQTNDIKSDITDGTGYYIYTDNAWGNEEVKTYRYQPN